MENSEPIWPNGSSWTVSDAPDAVIGQGRDGQEYELFAVMSATRTADGTIVVADQGSMEVRFYSAAGDFLWSVGGRGSGPGEFNALGYVAHFRADSLLVFDYNLDRVSILNSRGAFGRIVPANVGRNYWVRGVISDSVAILTTPGASSPLPLASMYWDSTYLLTLGLGLHRIDTVGKLPSQRRAGGRVSDASRVEPRSQFAAGTETIYFGTSEGYEVEEIDSDGAVRRVIRLLRPPVRVDAAVIEEIKRTFIAFIASTIEGDSPEGIARIESAVNAWNYPEYLPAYSSFIVDHDGNLWVERYRWLGRLNSEWDVIDPSGRWFGSVRMPDGLSVVQIGEDFVLGLARDSIGIESVRLHALRRD